MADLCGDHHQAVTAPEDTGGTARFADVEAGSLTVGLNRLRFRAGFGVAGRFIITGGHDDLPSAGSARTVSWMPWAAS
jgi:hypothetical protein